MLELRQAYQQRILIWWNAHPHPHPIFYSWGEGIAVAHHPTNIWLQDNLNICEHKFVVVFIFGIDITSIIVTTTFCIRIMILFSIVILPVCHYFVNKVLKWKTWECFCTCLLQTKTLLGDSSEPLTVQEVNCF